MKAVVSLSGGMDSATVLAYAVDQLGSSNVHAVGFIYGSKHNQYEQEAARKLADHYAVPYHLQDLTPVMGHFRSNLMKGMGEVPEGHYEEKSMSQTVVPSRNIIFASILSGHAWSLMDALDTKMQVWLGIHAGDHAIYPDCRPEFFYSMKSAILFGTDSRVELVAPFLKNNKTGIIREGLILQVPYEITRTCYKDQPIACGKCGSCQERLEAFKANGIEDPVEYESRELLPKK